MVKSKGYKDLVTHVFIDGDKYLESDTVFAVKKSLIRKLEHGIDDESKEKCLLLNFDIVMEKE
jgi:protocatechuate 3,4-dioxygenase beta subunit